jgi:hypothetical protein
MGIFPGVEKPIKSLCGVGFVPFLEIDAREIIVRHEPVLLSRPSQ